MKKYRSERKGRRSFDPSTDGRYNSLLHHGEKRRRLAAASVPPHDLSRIRRDNLSGRFARMICRGALSRRRAGHPALIHGFYIVASFKLTRAADQCILAKENCRLLIADC